MEQDQTSLLKGELMEEKLRQYFLNNGYYVSRSVKYNYKGQEITDIDIFLYGRLSSLSRERINVDLKNKKNPKAFERIPWAKGIQTLLGFENCIVATMDRREVVRDFCSKNEIILLDGSFLQKLPFNPNERITEEEFLALIAELKSFKTFYNVGWKNIYETSKSRLINEMDFSGFNSNLASLKYFYLKCLEKQKRDAAVRCTYLVLSHSILMLDYILKDVAFLEATLRRETLSDGFKFGNLGREGVNRTIDLAVKIAKSSLTPSAIKKQIDTTTTDVLTDFFIKADVSKKLFTWAVELEKMAFTKTIIQPNAMEINLKSLFMVFLDYFEINRKDYFETLGS